MAIAIPTSEELLQAHKAIAPYVHNTAVLRSKTLNEMSGASLFFKCENFQRMGAFKMRGATNAILALSANERERGVVTHSSGNFGQAVALAAKELGVPAYVVMPENAPDVKKAAVKGYGATVTECESTIHAREGAAATIQEETGATPLHPSNSMDVIVGNATAAMELLSEQPNLDVLCAPVGGGGLLAGTALAGRFFGKNCKTFGGEPQEVDDAYRSFHSGIIETNSSTNTIADGLRTHLGDQNFPIIQQHVEDIICVSEAQIITAMKLIWERMKLVVEPSSAVALAAILKNKEQFKDAQVGIIISGGNVTLSKLPFS